MAAAGGLIEPDVLAATKQELFSPDGGDGYVVADTQFAQERWLDDRRIDRETQSVLAPFNHVRVGSGYPDLVGVDHLDDELVAVDRLGDEPPLIAIEAKGYTQTGRVDVERGVLQAYDRLHEANVAYVAGPIEAISQSERTLARELNVGVLGVDRDGASHVLERPRVVGNRTAEEATALRFQAGAQGVADRSFGLNHPKNYLAVPLAVSHDGGTVSLLEDHVVSAIDDAIRGAVFLGLVTEAGTEYRPTALGGEVVRFARRHYRDVGDALAEFEDWQRSRKRFTDVAPLWGELTDGDVYHSPTVFQLKAMLYHAGILTERGSEPSNLDPAEDVWQLREPLSRWR